MGKHAFLRISFLFVVMMAIASSIGTISFYTWYRIAYHRLLARSSKQLEAIANTTAREIIDFIVQQQEAIHILSTKEPIIAAFSDSSDKNQLEQFIKGEEHNIDYRRILVLTPDSTVLFAIKAENLVGKKIFSNNTQSFFAQSFMRAIMAETFDISVFAIDPLLNEPALFICEPIIQNQKLIGILAVQLDDKKIYRLLSYKDLGTTGDIMLGQYIRNGAIIIAPMRYAPDIAFSKEGVCPKDRCPSLYHAVLGEQNTEIVLYNQSKKAIGTWRYIPMVNWGLVVKQEVQELTKSILFIKVFYYLLLCITIIFSLWTIVYYFSQRKYKKLVNIDTQ